MCQREIQYLDSDHALFFEHLIVGAADNARDGAADRVAMRNVRRTHLRSSFGETGVVKAEQLTLKPHPKTRG